MRLVSLHKETVFIISQMHIWAAWKHVVFGENKVQIVKWVQAIQFEQSIHEKNIDFCLLCRLEVSYWKRRWQS